MNKNNTAQKANTSFLLYQIRPDMFGKVDPIVRFHTHLSRFGDSDRLNPSGLYDGRGDIGFKNAQLKKFPWMKFLIITNPQPFYY
jgi:hypothetical protein